jgi:hypothetical protein
VRLEPRKGVVSTFRYETEKRARVCEVDLGETEVVDLTPIKASIGLRQLRLPKNPSASSLEALKVSCPDLRVAAN